MMHGEITRVQCGMCGQDMTMRAVDDAPRGTFAMMCSNPKCRPTKHEDGKPRLYEIPKVVLPEIERIEQVIPR